jgi:hypothetical protein
LSGYFSANWIKYYHQSWLCGPPGYFLPAINEMMKNPNLTKVYLQFIGPGAEVETKWWGSPMIAPVRVLTKYGEYTKYDSR